MSRLTVAPLAEFDPSGGRVKITAPYGDGRGHQGVDWGTTDGIEVGTTLYAPVDGYLENTGYDGPYTPSGGHTAGNWLWFRGDNGSRWKMFHLNCVTAPIGGHLMAGEPIAQVGNSGTQAAHLHLEEHSGSWGSPVDFTADAHEVINAGRWPGTPPKDWFDMATEADLRRIIHEELDYSEQEMRSWTFKTLDDFFKHFVPLNAIWTDGYAQYEVTFDGQGNRVRRRLRSPQEVDLLKVGRALTGKWLVDVSADTRIFDSWPLAPEPAGDEDYSDVEPATASDDG